MKTFLLITVFFVSGISFAQTGTIKGTIVDEASEPAIFSKIVLEKDGLIIQRVMTDFDGNFVFKDLLPGEYSVTAWMIGKDTTKVVGITVFENRLSLIDVELVDARSKLTYCCCLGATTTYFDERERAAGVGIKNE